MSLVKKAIRQVHRECVLLVEGDADRAFIDHLRAGSDSMPPFQVDRQERGGVTGVLEAIPQEVRVSTRKAVGIIVDADNSLLDRWKEVRDKLLGENVEVPVNPHPEGTIIAETKRLPRVGVWLMPDNASPGELENLVLTMIPGDDPVWPRSQSYIEGIPVASRKFIEEKIPKATVYAWLATRKRPGLIGTAVGKGDLRTDGHLASSFASWLRRLFRDL